MSRGLVGEKDDEELPGSLSDNEDPALFDEDMEALRRACMLTGTDMAAASTSGRDPSTDSDSDDDFQLVRSLQSRFSIPSDLFKPLSVLPPSSDGEEDDFETLRAIRRRFSAYDHDTLEEGSNGLAVKSQESNTSGSALDDISQTAFSDRRDSCIVSWASEDSFDLEDTLNNHKDNGPLGLIEPYPSDADRIIIGTCKNSSFPKSARVFFDAIRKNRACQKLFRSKLIQIEARIEEIKKLKERVKILKDFQVSCRRRSGLALSLKKDPRIQLISPQNTLKKSKGDANKVSPLGFGPAENCHVANYRLALTRFPLEFQRNKWTEAENENLGKGIKQQFQEMVFRVSVDKFSSFEGNSESFEDLLASIKDIEISSEEIREFLPKVNWDQLASMYHPGRSGAECEARWLNWEDPLINHAPWTINEDKHLLYIIQENGLYNWFEIAVSLGTKRTPFQCLARYQRSLNPCIMRREWTREEDVQLRAAVETYGESNWQTVASTLHGRTGTQCSNRWKKTLHPERKKVGRWIKDEDKRLTVAAMLFGSKSWKKICQFVPGRTHVQCRERWVNCLDPSLKMDAWTAEEDAKLEAAIKEHGYSWSKIAACVRPRTDSQCRRRWKELFPKEVPLLQAAKKIHRAAFVSNFVDRESERPLLGPNDFLLLPSADPASTSEPGQADAPSKQKGKSRKRPQPSANDGARVQNKGRCKKQKTGDEAAHVGPPTDTSGAEKNNELEQNTNGDLASLSEPGQPDALSKRKRQPRKRTQSSANKNVDRVQNNGRSKKKQKTGYFDGSTRVGPPADNSGAKNNSELERNTNGDAETAPSSPPDVSQSKNSPGNEGDCTLACFMQKMQNTRPRQRVSKQGS